MREHVITSAAFFQSALYANSRDMTPELSETLLLLSDQCDCFTIADFG